MRVIGKMLRGLFYAAGMLSALCLVGIFIFWPWSYARNIGVTNDTLAGNYYRLECTRGRIAATRVLWNNGEAGVHFHVEEHRRYDDFLEWSYGSWNTPADSMLAPITFLGVSWAHDPVITYPHGVIKLQAVALAIPFSYLALFFSILPVFVFRGYRRGRKRAREGLCPKCGYDLRAHGAGSVCPECGTPVLVRRVDSIGPSSDQRARGLSLPRP